MSAGNPGDPPGDGRQSGSAVFFSNPLMSDVESDWSPVHDAAFNGRLLGLRTLISQGACVNLATLDRVSPLHGACVQGHVACARLLMESGANVNSATVDGGTALSEASARGHSACVSLLLQHGADPLGRSLGPKGSPLHRAAAGGHPECVEALVRHGADVDQKVDQSGSPLHAAVANRRVNTATRLLQLGASVNMAMAGDSPLHMAARLSSPELVSVLMEHGADRSVRNSEGQRPLDLAPAGSPTQRLLGETRGATSLMQLCRINIRKVLGKERLGGVHSLHIPIELKDFLLYCAGPESHPLR